MKTYLLATAILGALATGCFWASLNAPATELLARIGVDPWVGSQVLAGVFGVALILALVPSAREYVRKWWNASAPTVLDEKTHHPNFDGLRLVLALSVLFFHIHNRTSPIYSGLFAAVPCFLAISGFVVLQSFGRSQSWLHFARKRFLRVMPAFIISLFFSGLLLGAPAIFRTIQIWGTFGFAASDNRPVGDGVVWSLSCEEVFYAALAVIYLAGGYRRPAIIWFLLFTSIVFAWQVLPGHSVLWSNVLSLGPAFWIGNLVYLYRDRLACLPKWIPCVALILTSFAFFVRGDDIQVQFIQQCAFVASLIWCAAFGPVLLPILKNDLSYGVYIYHLPILTVLLAHHLAHWLFISTGLLLTLSMATLSWFGIERYALQLKNWRPSRISTVPTSIASSQLPPTG